MITSPTPVEEIIETAEKLVANASGVESALFSAMGVVGNDAPKTSFVVKEGCLSLDANLMAARGHALFDKFRAALQQAVCQDFGYCAKRTQVDQTLKNYLPDIVKCLLVRIPVSQQLPGWLPPILGMFGVSAASLDVVIAFLVAWLIITGCNQLCACPAS